jgi:hypothetical protein
MHAIIVEANPVAVTAELDIRLGQFNEERVGPRHTFNFALSVRDGQGDLVAGLVGETLRNALLVSVLWVHARWSREILDDSLHFATREPHDREVAAVVRDALLVERFGLRERSAGKHGDEDEDGHEENAAVRCDRGEPG